MNVNQLNEGEVKHDGLALITGAASGIGREIAQAMSRSGFHVVLVDQDINGLKETVAMCSGPALPVYCKLPDQESIDQAVTQALEWGGSLEVLVNVAGIVDRANIGGTRSDQWQNVIDVNLTGLFKMCQAALPYIKRSQARSRTVINIASCAGEVGFAYPAYTASKGGVIALTRGLAAELSAYGITSNCICPGFVKSPINDTAFQNASYSDDVSMNIPLGRPGAPEEIATVVNFLASSGASFINAETIHVDGGMLGVLPGFYDQKEGAAAYGASLH